MLFHLDTFSFFDIWDTKPSHFSFHFLNYCITWGDATLTLLPTSLITMRFIPKHLHSLYYLPADHSPQLSYSPNLPPKLQYKSCKCLEGTSLGLSRCYLKINLHPKQSSPLQQLFTVNGTILFQTLESSCTSLSSLPSSHIITEASPLSWSIPDVFFLHSYCHSPDPSFLPWTENYFMPRQLQGLPNIFPRLFWHQSAFHIIDKLTFPNWPTQ